MIQRNHLSLISPPIPEDPSTFPQILKLSAQFSSFSQPSQFAEFFSQFLSHKTLDGYDLQALAFRWIYKSLDIFSSSNLDKAVAIAKKINKEKVTKCDLLNANKQLPAPIKPPIPSHGNAARLNIFDVPDDLLCEIYRCLSKKDRIESMLTCRHFAIIGFRPASIGRKLTVKVDKCFYLSLPGHVEALCIV